MTVLFSSVERHQNNLYIADILEKDDIINYSSKVAHPKETSYCMDISMFYEFA
jgi:hypothetical protein